MEEPAVVISLHQHGECPPLEMLVFSNLIAWNWLLNYSWYLPVALRCSKDLPCPRCTLIQFPSLFIHRSPKKCYLIATRLCLSECTCSLLTLVERGTTLDLLWLWPHLYVALHKSVKLIGVKTITVHILVVSNTQKYVFCLPLPVWPGFTSTVLNMEQLAAHLCVRGWIDDPHSDLGCWLL